MLKHSSEHRVRHCGELCRCLKMWEVLSLTMCSRTRVINAERFRRLLSHKRGFANLQNVIVTASILSWFVHILKYVMFGVKDPIPRGLRTCVVYKFFMCGLWCLLCRQNLSHFQNWRWQKNCRNMFLKDVFYFLKFVKYLLLSWPIHFDLNAPVWEKSPYFCIKVKSKSSTRSTPSLKTYLCLSNSSEMCGQSTQQEFQREIREVKHDFYSKREMATWHFKFVFWHFLHLKLR